MKELDPGDYWTPARKELRHWFEINAPSLGELYEGALKMLFSNNFPGRVRFVAHAVREIRNRLPDVVAGQRTGNHLDYVSRIDNLANEWQRHGLPTDGSILIDILPNEISPAGKYVKIHENIYKEVANIVRDHLETREKPYEAAKRLFEAVDPSNKNAEATLRPRITRWRKISEWFMRRAHDSGSTDDLTDIEELRRQFEIFESALVALTGEFFATVEELDEILEEANF